MGFPGSAHGKEPTCHCRRWRRHGLGPWVGKIPLEEGMETHSSILAWRIPWTEEPGEPQSKGSQRVGHNGSDLEHTRTCMYNWTTPLYIWNMQDIVNELHSHFFKSGLKKFLFKRTRAAEANGIERFRLQREKQKCTQDHQSTYPVYKIGGGKVLYVDGGVGYVTQSFLKTGVSWTHHICAFQHVWIMPQFKSQLLIKGL